MTTTTTDRKPTLLPLTALRADLANPRTVKVGAEADRELGQSMATHGILVPLLVRAKGDGGEDYVILDGHRRYVQAKALKLSEVPVRVLTQFATDDTRAIAAIVNLQRADLHPMDEARLLGELVATAGKDKGPSEAVDAIAAWVGRSRSHVQRRLGLLRLTPALQKLTTAGTIPLTAATALAGLPPARQGEAWTEASRWGNNPLGGLRDYLRRDELRLSDVPWAVADALLVPDAGACTACPKRTGANPTLFEGLELARVHGVAGKLGDQCLDAVCFKGKLRAFARAQLRAAAPASGIADVVLVTTERYGTAPTHLIDAKAKVLTPELYRRVEGKPCATALPAVDLGGRGKAYAVILSVCVDKACPTHGTTGKGQRALPGGGRRGSVSADAQARRVKAQDLAVNRAVCAAVLGQAPPGLGNLTTDQRAALTAGLLEHVRGEQLKELVLMLGWAPPRPKPSPKADRKPGAVIRRYLDDAPEILTKRCKTATAREDVRVLLGMALLGKYDGFQLAGPSDTVNLTGKLPPAFSVNVTTVRKQTLAALAAKGTPRRKDVGVSRTIGREAARKSKRKKGGR
jgi:ParB/RepB/Spo0J family partition protein